MEGNQPDLRTDVMNTIKDTTAQGTRASRGEGGRHPRGGRVGGGPQRRAIPL